MIPEQLNELERLANAATPGPWVSSTYEGNLEWVATIAPTDEFVVHGTEEVCRGNWNVADGAFIAAARTAVPDLIAEVRRLTRNLEDWTSVAKSMSHTAQQHSRECDRLRAENAALQAALRTPQP